MRRYPLFLVLFGAAPLAFAGHAEIRFESPALDWQSQALPVGNGSMGAMIFGSPARERMQFNESSLWTGGANPSGAYDFSTFGAYQNFGDLFLDRPGAGVAVSHPSELDHDYPNAAQGVDKSVDGTDAKWCLVHNSHSIVWQASYPSPVAVTSYSFRSAEDVPARDPRDWVLEASNDGSTWTQLDQRNLGAATTPVWPLPARNANYRFTPAGSGLYQYYRFVFTPNTSTTHFQIAEISFTGPPPGQTVVGNPSAADHDDPDPVEQVDKSVDGTNAKWCLMHRNRTIVWQTSYPRAATITGYTLRSANDVPARDPRNWQLLGSNDGMAWTELDRRSLGDGTVPAWPLPARNADYSFTPAASGVFFYYRLVFEPNTATTHFQVAEITLAGDIPESGTPLQYSRTLNLENAVHTTTWQESGVTYVRETFASHPHQVIATRMSASEPGKISAIVRMAGAHGESITAGGNEVGFEGVLINNDLRYATRARVLPTGGTLTVSGNTLVAKDCDSLVIFHAAATDYALDATTTPAFRSGVVPAGTVDSRLDAAEAAGYEAVRAAHVADYGALFGRVRLDLGDAPAGSITARLAAYKAGGQDLHLESLLFYYGRYLLISSSRDHLPANLQGLWNDNNNAPWFSDYHTNINLQMNYWATEPTNLAECHRPLLNFLRAIVPLSRSATRASFGAAKPGWTMRTSVNPFGGHGWEWDMPSSAWMMRHYWQHYEFTGDIGFLRDTAWPLMKEVCEFWIDRLVEDANGKLVAPDSWSPEHGPRGVDGVSYDQEVVWDLFTCTIAAEQVLGADPASRAVLEDRRSRLLIPAIGPEGQIVEWADPAIEAAYGYGTSDHRHTSHLFALYPGRQFNSVDTPDYVAAGKLSLADRGTSGDARQSWSWPWRVGLWARMGEAQKAHEMIRGLLTYNTYPNFFTFHQPGIFQIDGNLGIPGTISEMLLQNQGDRMVLLPALPAGWSSRGSFTGLCAAGGFEIDVTWQSGLANEVKVRSKNGKTARIRSSAFPDSPGAFLRGGGQTRALTFENGELEFPTTAGADYILDTAVVDTGDEDGDGATTYQEWLAGTDPNDGASRFQLAIVRDGEGWKASWPETPKRKYVLEVSHDLAEWNHLITRHPVTEGTAEVDLPSSGDNRCFYRVTVDLSEE